MTNKYSAMYYPECYVDSPKALATYLLLYDEIHLISLSDEAKNPTEYLRKIPAYTTIKAINKGHEDIDFVVSASEIRASANPGEIDKQTRRTLLFYQFVQRHKELIGNTIFFHPHLWASALNRITSKLLGEGLPYDELAKFIYWKDEEMGTIADFQKNYPSIQDEALWRIVPTATNIARERDFILVSDNSDIPVPVLSKEIKSVRNLTRILAEECIKIYVPSCLDVSPEEILEIRQALGDLLIPFRMSLQRLSKNLRATIEAGSDTDNIRQEAKFIAESQVEPAVFELKKKIENDNSKLFNRAFGKLVSWVPLVAKAFALPTPDNVFQVAKKVATDSGTLIEGLNDLSLSRDEGLCFLLRIDDEIKKLGQ